MSNETDSLKPDRQVIQRAGLVAVRAVTPMNTTSTIPPFLMGSLRMLMGNKIYWLLVFIPIAILAMVARLSHLQINTASTLRAERMRREFPWQVGFMNSSHVVAPRVLSA